jgi:quercetin dioxygenase-like cupin family protein
MKAFLSTLAIAVAGTLTLTAHVSAAPQADAITEAVELINPAQLKWVKTIPSAGKQSPEYAILRSDPKTNLTMLMFRTPVPVHIKKHTHTLGETHVVLVGGTHIFESNGKRYEIENGGFMRMPGGVVHEAWLPAGSQTLNILESGWVVNWLKGEPGPEDINKYPSAPAK